MTETGKALQTAQFTHFKLIGRDLTFRVVRRYLAGGEIPCVTGITLDGARMTAARVADVVPYVVLPPATDRATTKPIDQDDARAMLALLKEIERDLRTLGAQGNPLQRIARLVAKVGG